MKKILLIIIGIILIIALVIFGYFYYSIKMPISKNNKVVSIEITKGETTQQIAQELKSKKLIHNAFVFSMYSFYTGKQIMPGIYYLMPNMTLENIFDKISKGEVSENKIIILEGWRATEIAQYLADKNLVDKNNFLAKATDLEGYLFPDTYQLAKDATIDQIIKEMTDNFQARTKNLNITRDNLILASIVEREAQKDEDRAKIAGVYQNRLLAQMKLDADPTIQYAKGNWLPISQSDYYNVDSPYNTYLHIGLPPGPISNPGLASIRAAINPEKNDYFYFFHLKDGTTIYSKTLEEHNAKLIQYQDKI